jgi:hypothetical protein
VLILEEVKVVCFDTDLEVLILKKLEGNIIRPFLWLFGTLRRRGAAAQSLSLWGIDRD